MLFGLREVSLDNNPKTATVMKKQAVAYTNNFNVNINCNSRVKINKGIPRNNFKEKALLLD